jgi:DNA sulfur modification protein DndE
MSMALGIIDISNASYRTTRAADQLCSSLMVKLGWRVRYLPARLAIARSLSLPHPPSLEVGEDEDESANSIRGQQLFGDGGDPAAWLALILQRHGTGSLSRKEFQALVAAHWRRGAELLSQDWEQADGDLALFITRLAEFASFAGSSLANGQQTEDDAPFVEGEIILPVGEIATDVQTQEPVAFPLNAPGGSPHMAIMGGAGSGKTRTAVHMLQKLRDFGDVPILAFDFKGDLADVLSTPFKAEVVSPPRIAVPLDVLHVSHTDDTSLREAAGRIRESIARVKNTKIGGVQLEALREAILAVLRARGRGGNGTLSDISVALDAEYQQRQRRPDELTSTLSELTQFKLFDPKMTPADFFSRSWIIKLPQDGTAEVRRLIINLMLDALDRWLNALDDSPLFAGRRAVRHVTMLDEAHVILSTKLPALGNLVRMSRSKGGVVMLVSQSPDDFEGDDDGFLDNMGLTLGFSTQARPGATKAIFGNGVSLVDLPVGRAACRIRTEAKTRRILAWQPGGA